MSNVQTFTDASDWNAKIRDLPEADLLAMSDHANIGITTLQRIGDGSITPSKNQKRKIEAAASALTLNKQ